MKETLIKDIERLISLYEAQKARSEALGRQVEEAGREIDALKGQIDKKNSEIEGLKLKAAIASGTVGDEKLRRKVDSLIRQVDKCIETLEAL